MLEAKSEQLTHRECHYKIVVQGCCLLTPWSLGKITLKNNLFENIISKDMLMLDIKGISIEKSRYMPHSWLVNIGWYEYLVPSDKQLP